jgi:hypothetical protein
MALSLLAAFGAANAEEKKPAKDAPPAESNKPSLADVTRVSTDAVAESVAREQVRGEDETEEAKSEDAASQEEPASVVELKPRARDSEDAKDAAKVESKSSGKGPLKDVHGSVHGASDPKGSGSRAGGSVGATTRGGRSSIYVEGQRTRETPPRPQ